LSSLSSKSKLIKAKTRVAALEVEAAFLKEKQALKMAEEPLKIINKLSLNTVATELMCFYKYSTNIVKMYMGEFHTDESRIVLNNDGAV